MAVQVWVGEKPEHPNERRAIVALANGLDRLENLYLLLANFNVGGRTIDLVIIKQDALFIIELKHCDGKVTGGVNGHWFVEGANGERKRLNPGRKNPYNQVISYYYSLTNFLHDHRDEVVSEHKAASFNFRSCRRLIVFAPTLDASSEIKLDWKVEARGLDELPVFLVTERSPGIDLTEEEMLAIPQVLGCTRWHDINALIAGVLPNWHGEERLQEEVPEAPAAEPPAAEPVAATPPSLLRRIGLALSTNTGRLALATSVLAVVLLMMLIFGPMRLTADPPQESLIVSTVGPAGFGGGVFPDWQAERTPGCVWSGFQSVGKRWNDETESWISVGVDGIVADMAPEVVVTLEQVDYCGEQIILHWGVHNNSSRLISFPLRNDNITIRDPMGNQYMIDNADSDPATIRVKPNSDGEGMMVVQHPVSQHAPSLLVRLKEQPFGEASWLVSLEDN